MADKPISLNRYRKRRAKEEKQRTAERNRVIHGRSKAESQAAREERERAERDLAGKKLDGDEDPDRT